MSLTDTYEQARARARRTPTVLLRRQERRIVDRTRGRKPGDDELARLAAVRSELSVRTQRCALR